MHAKFIALASLFTLALAAPQNTENSCNVGSVQCCNSVQKSDNKHITNLAGLLGIDIGDITAQVGLVCDPISVIGVGSNSCTAQPVCCTGNHFNGLVAVGCSPIKLL